ncbi:transglutaminase TgpA family protein [Brevibacillus fluminis]|uniref:transglutaminase TgpA family protein n=1 Tax=Brevibacillus fluminis TaxID=511487 RepID=UPI003F8C2806
MHGRLLRPFKWLDLLGAAFLFFLIREWLLPLLRLTDTGDLLAFYDLIGGVLLLDLMLRSRWLGAFLKLAGALYLLHFNYIQTPLFSKDWLLEIFVRLQRDIPLAMLQHWTEMSLVTRNLLFYLMIAAIVSLLSYLVIEQRQALWFVIMTETYLATLDTFLPYEADGAIIRALIAGFLLLAVTHFSSMQQLAPAKGKSLRFWKTLIAPVMIIALAVGVAYAGPKHDPEWPDPIAYFTGNGSEVGTGYVKRVGFDNSDELLGGPFVQDNGLVFTATTNEKTYWRADSKDVYSGVGWQKGERSYEDILNPATHAWKDQLFKGFETKKVEASLQFSPETRYPTIFYPGQLTGVKNYKPANATFVYDKDNEQVEVRAGQINVVTQKEGQPPGVGDPKIVPNTILMKMNHYDLTAEVPIISEKKILASGSNYPAAIKEKYLQLPKELPQRVKDLAEKVTANAKTPYEKVRAVENFLRTGGEYSYETTDVPVLQQGQDFVDQFLFVTKRGYCDHFSSSMAVMLRTVGIPTRWVKGFAPGTETQTRGDQKVMEIHNKDAHSWVEVYFPDYGWIPFEATSSFISPLRVQYDLANQPAAQPIVPGITPQKPRDLNPDRLDERDAQTGGAKKSSGFSWGLLLGIGVILAIAGFVFWKKRDALYIWWLHRRMTSSATQRFPDKYNALIRLYERIFTRRQQGETLREYVKRLEVSGDRRQDLLYVTQLFERILYGFKELEGKAKETGDKIMERLTNQLKP